MVWAYDTTSRTTTKEIPSLLTFGVEAVMHEEMVILSLQVEGYDEQNNVKKMMAELDLMKKKKDQAYLMHLAVTLWMLKIEKDFHYTELLTQPDEAKVVKLLTIFITMV